MLESELNVPKKLLEYNQALQYCYLLLKYRKRSEQELVRRLSLRQCPVQVQKKTIACLRESGLITKDADFAREWAEYKLSSGYGINRIAQGLMQRGISREAIGSLRAVFHGEKRPQVLQAIRQVTERKTKQRALDLQQRQKLIRFLLSRGFLSDEIIEVLDEVQ